MIILLKIELIIEDFSCFSALICFRGGVGSYHGSDGENGTITGKACPRGLYGIFCEVVSQVITFRHHSRCNFRPSHRPTGLTFLYVLKFSQFDGHFNTSYLFFCPCFANETAGMPPWNI